MACSRPWDLPQYAKAPYGALVQPGNAHLADAVLVAFAALVALKLAAHDLEQNGLVS
jgi:hypothetical protein